MVTIFDSIKKGDERIIQYFKDMETKWLGIYEGFDWDSSSAIETLAEKISAQQMSFEFIAQLNRSLGQELMVITAYSSLYHINYGFDDNKTNAIIIKKAFEASFCSS